MGRVQRSANSASNGGENAKLVLAVTPSPPTGPTSSCTQADALGLVNETPSHMVQALPTLLPLCWTPGQLSLCMSSLRAESPFPTSLIFSQMKALLLFKIRLFGGWSLQCRSQGLGSLMWGTNPALFREKCSVHEIPPACGLLCQGWGFGKDDAFTSPTCLNAAALFFVVLGFSVHFQVLPRESCSIFSCRFVVYMGGSEFRIFLHCLLVPLEPIKSYF